MSLFYIPQTSAFGVNVREFPGATLNFYEPGTTTPKTTYTDNAETTPHAADVTANGFGVFAPIYFTGNFKVILKDKDGVVQYTADNVTISAGNMDFLGDFDTSTNAGDYPATGNKGDTYRVSTGFTLNALSGSHILITGDQIRCNKDEATGIDADWDILRTADEYDASGKRTISSLGTNQDVDITPSGTGNTNLTTGNLELAGVQALTSEILTLGGNQTLSVDASKKTTLQSNGTNQDLDLTPSGTGDSRVVTGNLDIVEALKGVLLQGNSVLSVDASGAITVNSIGTNQDIIIKGSGTGGLVPTNGIKISNQSEYYDIKRIDIGDWDMVATASINVAHGLTLADILEVSVWIYNDAASSISPIGFDSGTGSAGRFNMNTTNVILWRTLGGLWDSTNYDSTSYNRGHIYIKYKV